MPGPDSQDFLGRHGIQLPEKLCYLFRLTGARLTVNGECCQTSNRWHLKKTSERYRLRLKSFAQPCYQAHGQERVTSQIEKVIVHTHALNTEQITTCFFN